MAKNCPFTAFPWEKWKNVRDTKISPSRRLWGTKKGNLFQRDQTRIIVTKRHSERRLHMRWSLYLASSQTLSHYLSTTTPLYYIVLSSQDSHKIARKTSFLPKIALLLKLWALHPKRNVIQILTLLLVQAVRKMIIWGN